MYQENFENVKQMERDRTLIWPANEQLDEMGKLDLHKNKTIWNTALQALKTIPLWEAGAPNYDDRDPDQLPPMLAFLPSQGTDKPRGTILVSHGGALVCRAGHEGFHTAACFASQGFNTAVLSYRLAPYDKADSLADIQRAVRVLRSKREELGITDKIVCMGFSAGGYLSGLCAVHCDAGDPHHADPVERYSCRPDAVVLCYGARTEIGFPGGFRDNPFADPNRRERFYFDTICHITPDMPPVFLWQTISDDPRHAFAFGSAMAAAGVPCEIHCFDAGFHGVGLADGNNDGDFRDEHLMKWADLAVSWLKRYDI
jgi:acetyl esterase/lipase